MAPLPLVVYVLYLICQAGLILAGLHRLRLLFALRRPPLPIAGLDGSASLPRITVQLPIHNERLVVQRLIRAVARMDYPTGLLQIQVLDDSTDATCGIAEECSAELRAQGVDVKVLHRENRDGYKAGALAAGLAAATGELIAVFDADFVPPRDFLLRAIPAFSDPGVGMAQARWSHLNEPQSLLTRVQAIFLDGHFQVEHRARSLSGDLFNFNGTAGVWRRRAIEEAGGWQHDTLTEDLDLSYRAQLCGWRFVYLEDLEVPAELPGDMNAFKSQQYRWAKGSIQTARKLLPAVLRSNLPAARKLEAAFHLLANVTYPMALVPALLMLPLMWLPGHGQTPTALGVFLPVFLLSTGAFVSFFIAGLLRSEPRRAGRWLALPAVLMVGIGMSLQNTRAVIAGLCTRGGEFHRTPKRGPGRVGKREPAGYRARVDSWGAAELVLASYFAVCAAQAVDLERFEAVPFLGLFALGFAYVGGLTVLEALRTGLFKSLQIRSFESAAQR